MSLPAFRDSKTAFVILTWNSEQFIASCLESVLSLFCEALDVYVVDNGSVDGTVAVLEGLAVSNSSLHLILEEDNLGTTVSRNKALRMVDSDTDYICILDSDTVVNQSALESMAEALRLNPGIGVVGPTMVDSSDTVQLSGRNLPTLSLKVRKAWPFGRVAERAAKEERPSAPVADGLQDVGYLLSACWLMPSSSLMYVGLLDEAIFYAPEDVDWCARCWDEGLRVCLCPGARIVHEYQRISHKRLFSKANLEHIKGLSHYFLKRSRIQRC